MRKHFSYGSVSVNGLSDYQLKARQNPISIGDEVYDDIKGILLKYRKVIPLIVLIKVLVVAFSLVYAYKSIYSGITDIASVVSTIDCSGCPKYVKHPNCTDPNYPVLGGVDFVQYFGFTNESMTGLPGNENISTVYNGYRFYFISETNKDTFLSNPEKYSPQFGGFCSWGVAGEYCPEYNWNYYCLGPSGNWGIWTIYDEKLYFFFLTSAKELFMSDVEYYSSYGANRWANWKYEYNGIFDYNASTMTSPSSDKSSDELVYIYNTQCYHNSSSFVVKHKMNTD